MQINKFIAAISSNYSLSEAKKIADLFAEKYNLNDLDDATIHNYLKRINNLEPIQYIIEEAWFYDTPFYVNKHTLIPRPETEELVDFIIKENKSKKNLSIVDIGTGTGCIPITLKRKIPDATIWAIDISTKALHIAKMNAATYHTDINFLAMDFLAVKNDSFPLLDIIVSNPPYIPQSEEQLMDATVTKHEPHTALFVPDNNPLVFYEQIKNFAKSQLKNEGIVYVETHYQYALNVAAIFSAAAFETTIIKDITGNNRFVKAIKKP